MAHSVETPASSLAFLPTDTPGEFQFDTGVINGLLRPEGKSLGLKPATHVESGVDLSRSMGLFNYYRLFTTNHRFGESARSLPCDVSLESDGSVRVFWAGAEDRPFDLQGVYRWTAADTLDLVTTVTAKADLPDLEVFLAAYLSEAFPVTHIYAEQPGGPAFITPEKADGVWHAYPTGDHGRKLVKDGRWTYPPSPVDWVMPADAAAPLAFRRDPESGVVVIVMAPPGDCFAMLTPCRGEGHRSMYLSLFGQDVKAGETVHARARLVVGRNLTDEQILSLYQAYLREADDKDIPSGYTMAAHLNCGVDESSGKPDGPRIRQIAGHLWEFPDVSGALGTAAHHESQVEYKIAGLDADSQYFLGFTWWDADGAGRIQSVKFGVGGSSEWTTVLPATPALAFDKGKPTRASGALPIPASYIREGALRVAFAKHAGPNVVVNELSLLKAPANDTRKRVLLITGDDYPGHVWRETAPVLARALRQDPRLDVHVTEALGMVASPLSDHYDALVIHFKNYAERIPLDAAAGENLKRYVASGKGLVLSHFACGAFQEWPGFVDIVGRVWNPKLRGHDPHGEFKVTIVDDAHPITKGLGEFATTDELYTCLDGTPDIHVLCEATSKVDQKVYPIAFTVPHGKGRVFQCTLGHDTQAFESKEARTLYQQATVWAAGL
ncbi:MAG: ThuA domain-containing protein [bacterium]|nr:ThuA domain-containing protein [bacterium]